MEFVEGYLFEAVVALFVTGFAWGFRSWAHAIRDTSERIMRRLDAMAADVHGHRVESIEAFARLDERVKALELRVNHKSLDPD